MSHESTRPGRPGSRGCTHKCDQNMRTSAKLKGHGGSVCCVKAFEGGNTILSGAEDGCVCAFDLRNNELLDRLQLADGDAAVPSFATQPNNSCQYFCCSGEITYLIDRRKNGSEAVLDHFHFNRDEINALAVNAKGSLLAAADDAGEVTIFNLESRSLVKSLKGGHSNIASSIAFRKHRPWEILSGGLDTQVICWDFSTGRVLNLWSLGEMDQSHEDQDGMTQSCNPPFVHCIATPDAAAERPFSRVFAAACGDGTLAVVDADLGTKARRAGGDGARDASNERLFVDKTHCAAANVVCFPSSGRGAVVATGGNDGMICIRDWTRHLPEESPFRFRANTSRPPLVNGVLQISHRRKVNCVEVVGKDSMDLLVVADVSKYISVYKLQ